jgi:hypothetical protein
MELWLRSILSRIRSGELLLADHFSRLDCSAVLNARDHNPAFEANWVRLFNEVRQLASEHEVTEIQRGLVDDIRRESFAVVSHATRQHEIASYVSDDFDLMIRARILGIDDGLLHQMWEVYMRGEFPVSAAG